MRGVPDPLEIRQLVERSLEDSKAEDVVILDLEGKSSIADFMVVASGRSSRQVAAIADHLAERLKAAGVATALVEGRAQGDWVLVDAGDVIIHVFRPEVRAFYNIEKLWGLDQPVRGQVIQVPA